MTRTLVTADEDETDKTPAVEPLALLQMAIDRGTDPDKLGKLVDLAERMERNRAASDFGQALAAFQAECPRVKKGRKADVGGKYTYQFASFDDVMRQAGPILAKNGLAVSFSTEQTQGGLRVTCRIRHGTHSEDHGLTVPIPSMNVNDTQKYGAALSYAKRYALCAALNIVVTDEDDDAGGLHETISKEQAMQIEDLLTDTKSDRARFLKWAGVKSVDAIPLKKFAAAVDLLERKKGGSK